MSQEKSNSKDVIIEVLAEVIRRQAELTDYRSSYSAYLLGQITIEEFREIAESYAQSFDSELTPETKQKIDILFQYTHGIYTASDVSDLFLVDEEAVELYLKEKFNVKSW